MIVGERIPFPMTERLALALRLADEIATAYNQLANVELPREEAEAAYQQVQEWRNDISFLGEGAGIDWNRFR